MNAHRRSSMGTVLLLLLGAAGTARAQGAAPATLAVRAVDGDLVAEVPVAGEGEVCARAWLLDAGDERRWGGAARGVPRAGRLSVPLRVPLAALTPEQHADVPALRLKTVAAPCGGAEPAPSTAALSTVLEGAFEVRARDVYLFGSGAARLHVDAVERGAPAAGVTVEAVAGRRRVVAVTGPEGTAVLELPAEEPLEEASEGTPVRLVARRGGLVRALDVDVYTWRQPSVLLSTDKRLYQPGQVLHVRVLAVDPERRPVASRAITLRIGENGQGDLFRAEVTTSRFGVASVDWPIPAEAETGDYDVKAWLGSTGDVVSRASVRVSRYELPTFTVSATASPSWIAPGDIAELTVRATYLSGQPLPRFRARVLRPRSWSERRDEVQMDVVARGEAEGDGAFRARVTPPRFEKTRWRLFEDTEYEAEVTDPTTGRTERRHVPVRVSAEPLHVYLVNAVHRGGGMPSTLYVSTFSPDGAPRRAVVEVLAKGEVVGRFSTGVHGLGKLETALPGERELTLRATDETGRVGTAEVSAWDWGPRRDAADEGVRLRIARRLLPRGAPFPVDVETTYAEGTAFVEVGAGYALLDVRAVPIHAGRGRVTFPWRPEFRGPVSVLARVGRWTGERRERPAAVDGVLYEDDRELAVGATPSRKSFRPGAEASVRLTLRGRSGAAPGVLGVAVVDRAAEERGLESDGWWGPPDHPFTSPVRLLFERDEELGGVRFRDLLRRDARVPLPDDLALVVEALLGREWSFASRVRTSVREADFGPLLAKVLRPAKDALTTADEPLPRSAEELERRLASHGIAAPRDPWDVPLQADFTPGRHFEGISWRSAGPDQRFGTGDDLAAGTFERTPWTMAMHALGRALETHHRRTGLWIASPEALRAELERNGETPAGWREADGSLTHLGVRAVGLHVVAELEAVDGVRLASASIEFGAELVPPMREALLLWQARTGCPPESDDDVRRAFVEAGLEPEPVDAAGRRWAWKLTSEREVPAGSIVERGGRRYRRALVSPTRVLELRTADGWIADRVLFAGPAFVQEIEIENPQAADETTRAVPPPGTAPAIEGTVLDQGGQALPGVTVVAWAPGNGETHETVTDGAGRFAFPSLADGTWVVECRLSGFTTTKRSVEVRGGRAAAPVEARLDVTVKEEVVVTGEAPVVATRSQTATATAERAPGPLPALPPPTSTPRLRTFFPETLAWAPHLVTGADGRATMRFRLADNVTTWVLSAVGSTEDGRLGVARTELTAFQPFFVDHDPPRRLTVGDEIALPVVVRNYTARDRRVALEFAEGAGLCLLEPGRREVEVPANDSKVERFRFRAERPVAEAKQRVTARVPDTPRLGDAVEKPLSVRRNAEEIVVPSGALLRGRAFLAGALPAGAIPGSIRARLTLYPGVLAQLAESIEAVLLRPWGCAEQTISSAYPSVLMLETLKRGGAPHPGMEARARRFVAEAVQRLQGMQDVSGAFPYFGGREGDPALTAYALGFLLDAAPFVPVPEALRDRAVDALARAQSADGAWRDVGWSRRPLSTSALAVRVLARARETRPGAMAAARRGFDNLSIYVKDAAALGGAEEGYFLATYALAAEALGEVARADAALARLRMLAVRDARGARWPDRGASPFWSWGRAGEVEVTALAAQALLARGSDAALADEALLFLLREKDRDGIWFSGHATAEALRALLAGAPEASGAGTVRVLVDGAPAGDLPLPADAFAPVVLDLSSRVHAGAIAVTLEAPPGVVASARLALAADVPWRAHASEDLGFDVAYERTEARVGQEIGVDVLARRTSERGGGMLLAQVGIPPGAEVDRAVLEELVRDWGKGVWRYEVQPDRVVFYVWPSWGARETASRFSFRFRPRYPVKALSAPSLLEDYYNPDARVAVPPARFVVR